MQDSAVCPYFDHDEDVCDVGCGYISSHDASMIIKFCSCQYQDCQKYRELADRIQIPEPALPVTPPTPARPVNHLDNLPVLGLFSYSITTACYALDKLPTFSFNLHLLAIILMLGAVGQISAGLNALKNKAVACYCFHRLRPVLALDPRSRYPAKSRIRYDAGGGSDDGLFRHVGVVQPDYLPGFRPTDPHLPNGFLHADSIPADARHGSRRRQHRHPAWLSAGWFDQQLARTLSRPALCRRRSALV